MTPQEAINQRWRISTMTDAGETVSLVPPTQATTLRKPYQYAIPAAEFARMVQEINELLKPFEAAALQCGSAYTKPTSYGKRLNLFLLGYKPGYTGDASGITREQWDECTRAIIKRLTTTLGSVPVFVEPWTDKRKFQARFETYVLFPELDTKTTTTKTT